MSESIFSPNRKVSELESVLLKSVRIASVRFGKCLNWNESELECVRIGKCQNQTMSEFEGVRATQNCKELELLQFGRC